MQAINKTAIFIKGLHWKHKAFCLFLTVLFIFLIHIAIAPLHKMQEFQSLVNSDSIFLDRYNSIYNHPEMMPLVKEKTFKEAQLKLAESDSIQLLINLSDSSVSLSIKGVVIHHTKVRSINRNNIFNDMPLMQEVKLFSEPLPVYYHYATIVKEPIVVHHAPKDTLEASKNIWHPDTMIQNPAFLILSVKHGIDLILEQADNPTCKDGLKKISFYSRLRIRSSFQAISNFVRLRKQEYHPAITIKLPVDELRSIYRALPDNPLIVIKI